MKKTIAASFHPPQGWKQLYDRVVSYRRVLKAPVDTIGCHMLADRTRPREEQRFHILVALMLSSQTKDAVTAAAMEGLLKHGLTPTSVAGMSDTTLDRFICKVGFHNMKTKYIKQTVDIILTKHNGKTPTQYSDIIALPGVGPKMAYLFLQEADGVNLGIGVDTHVHRIARRFHWTPASVRTPEDTRSVLQSWLPKEHWGEVNHLLVGLGQTVCAPVSPRCCECELRDICPSASQTVVKKRMRDLEDVITPSPKSPTRRKKSRS